MERFTSRRNSKKYGFVNGEEFSVLRTIMNDCVLVIKDESKPNIIVSENELRYYGELTGMPALGGR